MPDHVLPDGLHVRLLAVILQGVAPFVPVTVTEPFGVWPLVPLVVTVTFTIELAPATTTPGLTVMLVAVPIFTVCAVPVDALPL